MSSSHIYNVKIVRLPADQLVFKMMHHAAKTVVPKAVDLRSKMPSVYDQGRLGSCTANALCAAFQYVVPRFMGSRLFLYYNERVMINSISDDAGAYLSDGVKCLQTVGLCAETLWPYVISKFAVRPPNPCYTAALKNKAVTVHNVQNTLLAMKQSLAAGLPFVVGIAIFSSFESATVARTGVVPMPSRTDKFLGGHAVLVCGYDDATQRWLVRNSWGTSWGNRGYFTLPYAYLLSPSLATDLWSIETTNVSSSPRSNGTVAPVPQKTNQMVLRRLPRFRLFRT